MQYYYGKELLGVYSVGFNVAAAVLIIATTLSLSLIPFLFEQLSSLPGLNRQYVVRMLYANVFVVILGVILASVLAGIVLRLMTTPAYHAARQFVPALAIGFAFTGMTLFVKPILIRFEQQKYISLVALANLALFLVLSFALTRLFGYMGIAYAFGASSLLLLVLLLVRTQAVLPLPWIRALLPNGKPGA
jgi:O-antigen/teichoic acid export membrane protein